MALEIEARQRNPVDCEERLGDRAGVHRPGASAATSSSATASPGCASVSGRERAGPWARRSAPRRLHGEDGREHRETGRVRRRHDHALAGEPERRLDETRPGQPPVAPPERVEPGRDAGHRARAGPDRVVDELLAERHLQLDGRRARAGGYRQSSSSAERPSQWIACPPPSNPVMIVSATQDARQAATAASAAVPPSSRISIPAATVSGDRPQHRLGAWVAT